MSRGFRRPSPALVVACIALFAALGGTVYAAKVIDGRQVKPRSLPGNRVAPNSLPGNRLKAGSVTGIKLAPGSVDGTRIDAATLGQVPSAVHADRADSAGDAETALNAVSAISADTVNGHSVGCETGTRPFAGACWQAASSEAAVTATAAAESCAAQGGELPDALALAAFSKQPGVALADGGEWSGEIPVVSGLNLYGVVTVLPSASVSSAVSSETRKYRCVIPLVG
jgi:hypothetical protein